MKTMKPDYIYDTVDRWMKEGRIEELDLLIHLVPITADTDTLLVWLTASLPMKSHLPSRQRIVNELVSREGEAIVKGL